MHVRRSEPHIIIIIRSHRSTTYVDATDRYSVLAWSVRESRSWASKNGWTDRDGVMGVNSGGPKEPCIRWASRSPRKGAIRGIGRSIIKYRHDRPCAAVIRPFVKLLWPLNYCLSKALDRPSNQFFPSVCVFVNRSVVERLRPQFFTDFHKILHAAQKCGRFVAYYLWDKPEVVCRF